MPKEVLAAIIVGGLLGIAIAFGVWRANIALSTKTVAPQNQTAKDSPSASPVAATTLSLTITSPDDLSVVAVSTQTITGISAPNSMVSISSDKSETIVTADSKGDFSGAVELSEGTNVVTVTSFTSEGETTEKQITLVYSTEINRQQ